MTGATVRPDSVVISRQISTLLFCRTNESMKKLFTSGTRRHANADAFRKNALSEISVGCSSPFAFANNLFNFSCTLNNQTVILL
uniref:Uncharacterized protein n=1 Tax=Parascaris univalens TaxID=6257 RepID=A0A915B2C1_PARUN